jgi:hypothetical protein
MNGVQSAAGRRVRAWLAVTAVMALAACGGGSRVDPSSTPAPSTTLATIHSTESSTSAAPSTVFVPPTPTVPTPVSTTVPADVPTTGPNITKAGEAPPVMPVAATLHSGPGGVAFAKFFIQTMDWAFATTNGSYMRHYYLYSCTTCRSVADGVDRSRAAGIRYIGDRSSGLSGAISTADSKRSSDLTVRVSFNVTAGESVDLNGKAVQAEPPQPGFVETIYLVWKKNGWIVTDMVPKQ